MDLTSRLRAIVRSPQTQPVRELTYEPDGGYETGVDVCRVGEILGGRVVQTTYGNCLAIDRRYESDRFHGDVRIGECELADSEALCLLDPLLEVRLKPDATDCRPRLEDVGASAFTRTSRADATDDTSRSGEDVESGFSRAPRIIFIDLETTGLSGGAGTVAFLVGCGYFDLGAFQVRQFLLTSYSAERALLAAAAAFLDNAELIVSYNGKTFDLPVMETRWSFHRLERPFEGVPHFDMLHPARRLWRGRDDNGVDESGCRLSTLERLLFDVVRIGDVPGLEIPGRFFRFLRSGDPRPLEPVLEHNRLDLVSLAAVTARAATLVTRGHEACRDAAEALSVGKVLERAGDTRRAEACYHAAIASGPADIRAEALYRLGLRCRRDRRFQDAAAAWRQLLDTDLRGARDRQLVSELRRFAAEALAIHREHRSRDLDGARDLALMALAQSDERRAPAVRHRLARLNRKIERHLEARGMLLD
jgi:uncharacterized protein YprB with RNaseH-like and TPR domain